MCAPGLVLMQKLCLIIALCTGQIQAVKLGVYRARGKQGADLKIPHTHSEQQQVRPSLCNSWHPMNPESIWGMKDNVCESNFKPQ